MSYYNESKSEILSASACDREEPQKSSSFIRSSTLDRDLIESLREAQGERKDFPIGWDFNADVGFIISKQKILFFSPWGNGWKKEEVCFADGEILELAPHFFQEPILHAIVLASNSVIDLQLWERGEQQIYKYYSDASIVAASSVVKTHRWNVYVLDDRGRIAELRLGERSTTKFKIIDTEGTRLTKVLSTLFRKKEINEGYYHLDVFTEGNSIYFLRLFNGKIAGLFNSAEGLYRLRSRSVAAYLQTWERPFLLNNNYSLCRIEPFALNVLSAHNHEYYFFLFYNLVVKDRADQYITFTHCRLLRLSETGLESLEEVCLDKLASSVEMSFNFQLCASKEKLLLITAWNDSGTMQNQVFLLNTQPLILSKYVRINDIRGGGLSREGAFLFNDINILPLSSLSSYMSTTESMEPFITEVSHIKPQKKRSSLKYTNAKGQGVEKFLKAFKEWQEGEISSEASSCMQNIEQEFDFEDEICDVFVRCTEEKSRNLIAGLSVMPNIADDFGHINKNFHVEIITLDLSRKLQKNRQLFDFVKYFYGQNYPRIMRSAHNCAGVLQFTSILRKIHCELIKANALSDFEQAVKMIDDSNRITLPNAIYAHPFTAHGILRGFNSLLATSTHNQTLLSVLLDAYREIFSAVVTLHKDYEVEEPNDALFVPGNSLFDHFIAFCRTFRLKSQLLDEESKHIILHETLIMALHELTHHPKSQNVIDGLVEEVRAVDGDEAAICIYKELNDIPRALQLYAQTGQSRCIFDDIMQSDDIHLIEGIVECVLDEFSRQGKFVYRKRLLSLLFESNDGERQIGTVISRRKNANLFWLFHARNCNYVALSTALKDLNGLFCRAAKSCMGISQSPQDTFKDICEIYKKDDVPSLFEAIVQQKRDKLKIIIELKCLFDHFDQFPAEIQKQLLMTLQCLITTGDEELIEKIKNHCLTEDYNPRFTDIRVATKALLKDISSDLLTNEEFQIIRSLICV